MTRTTMCKGTTAQGKRCRAPASLVNPSTRLCPSHTAGASQRLSEAGRKGAATTARKLQGGGLPASELGPLESVEDALRRLRIVGEAVGERRITHSEGATMVASLREWLRGEDIRLRAQDLKDVQAQIAELKNRKSVKVAS